MSRTAKASINGRTIHDILDERQRQIEKFGKQDYSTLEWHAVFAEECGEVSKLVCKQECPPHSPPDDEAIRAELVQVAAVSIAWIEALDRKKKRRRKR